MAEDERGCGLDSTNPVGSISPGGDSRDGVRNMGGNVREWTSSLVESGNSYAVRGGHWATSVWEDFVVSRRLGGGMNERAFNLGIRCAKG